MQGVFKKVFELSDWDGDFLCPLTPRIGEGLFRKVFLKKIQKNFEPPNSECFLRLDGAFFDYVYVSSCTMPGSAFSVSCKLLRYKFR